MNFDILLQDLDQNTVLVLGSSSRKRKYAISVVNEHHVEQLDIRILLIPHVQCQLFQFQLPISIPQLVPDTY